MFFSEEERQDIAEILENVAREGLPGPRDLDVALDAIDCTAKEAHRVKKAEIEYDLRRKNAKDQRLVFITAFLFGLSLPVVPFVIWLLLRAYA